MCESEEAQLEEGFRTQASYLTYVWNRKVLHNGEVVNEDWTEYKWDIEDMTQTNLKTGFKRRMLRLADNDTQQVLSPYVVDECERVAKRQRIITGSRPVMT